MSDNLRTREDATVTTISITELRDRLDDPALTDRRRPDACRIQRLAARRRGPRRPHPGRGRLPGRLARHRRRARDRAPARDQGHHRRARRRRLRRRGPRCPARSPTGSTALGVDGVRILEGGASAWAADPTTCPSSGSPNYDKLVHIRVAPRPPRGRTPGGAAQRAVRALPRQLRRARGIRRGPHPGSALPRHELAGGPGRLEPPFAGGHQGGPRGPRDHPRHDGRRLRPRHRRPGQREVAGPSRRPDRRDAGR